MAKARQKRTRAIPEQYATWREREAAADAARVRFVADLNGDAPHMYWVIRNRETGEVERCPTVTKSEVEARVAVLNAGEPTRADNQSWGKLTKVGRRVKSADSAQLSATEWVERLVSDPRTSAVLHSDATISPTKLRELMAAVDEGERQVISEELFGSVAQQLYRKFGARTQKR